MQAARRAHSQALEYDTDLPTYDFPPGGADGDTTAFEIKFTPTQNTMLGWAPLSPPYSTVTAVIRTVTAVIRTLTAVVRTPCSDYSSLTVPLQVRADAEHHGCPPPRAKETHKSECGVLACRGTPAIPPRLKQTNKQVGKARTFGRLASPPSYV